MPAATDGPNVYEQMTGMITAYWTPQVIRAAISLSLPEHLHEASLTADEIARREGSAPGTTFRLLRALVFLGLATADDQARFTGTPLLDTLRKDAPGSLRGLSLATSVTGHWLPWAAFTDSVRSGETQVAKALGTDFFTYLDEHPDEAREFSEGMTSTTAAWVPLIAQLIDTTGVKVVADIGGAQGALLHVLLQQHPDLRGIVFERPAVVESALAETAKQGLSDRVEVIGGDFFQSVPSAGLFLLKQVLHDWNDEQSIVLLRTIKAAMQPGSRLLIIEQIVGDPSNPGFAAMMDMNMLAIVPGQERSLAEYDALITAAGLRRTGTSSAGPTHTVIEVVAA